MRSLAATLGGCLGIVLVVALGFQAMSRPLESTGAERLPPQSSTSTHDSPAGYRKVLEQYCFGCHSQTLQTAGLVLGAMDLARVGEEAEAWEKVLGKLQSRSMPPASSPRPDKATYTRLISWLQTQLNSAARENPNPGRPAVHRLNRAEYANAIRDLLALEIDVKELLPSDDLGYGFDNIADVLSFSPLLLERYLSAARTVSRLAVGDPSIRPSVKTYKPSPLLFQHGRMSEELPFGSDGGLAIRHHFPLDGHYVLKIALQRQRVAKTRELDVRLDGKILKRLRLAGGDQPSAYGQPADGDLEVQFLAGAGPRLIGVSFRSSRAMPEGLEPIRLPVASFRGSSSHSGVLEVRIEGPYRVRGSRDTANRKRIFICRPIGTDTAEEERCAREILARMARRAFRRPVEEEDLRTLLGFYHDGRQQGGFERGVQAALERILVDPEFLFRIERDPEEGEPSQAFRLRDIELASRLSFFLWSSIPDDELLQIAVADRLKDPRILEQQVRRMLADERSGALVRNFASQWLHLRNIRAAAPDLARYPEWDHNLRDSFQRETELFLGSQLREDQSIVSLLAARYSFVNERLARHYGIPNIYGNRFRRVSFDDGRRGGLLGQGSLLTVTSYANRTSPVLRGRWLLENILGTPVPAPPPDIPELSEDGAEGEEVSLREQLEKHSRNPACVSCHQLMDPLGFALENFDAIGGWRTLDERGAPIRAVAELPDGTSFEGPLDLRNLLLRRRTEFVTTVTRKLLTYAVGRGIEYYDLPAIRTILREAAETDYRWSSIILGIVRSPPFQMKRAKP